MILRSFLLWLILPTVALAQESPRLIIDPQGHSGTVQEVLFTPDGRQLISLAEDKTIRLWEVESGDLIKTIRGHIGDGPNGLLFAGALSPDGQVLAVGGFNQSREHPIRLYKLATGEQVGLLDGHINSIMALDFSPDGQYLASVSQDLSVRLWDLASRRQVAMLTGHDGAIYDVAFSPEGHRLVSASFDHTLRLWDVSSGKAIAIMRQHTAEVYCVAWSPDRRHIVSGGLDGRILLWDEDGKFVRQIDELNSYVTAVAFAADSRKIVVAQSGTDDMAYVYTFPEGQRRVSFLKHNNAILASAFFGNDLVATGGGNDSDIFIWQVPAGGGQTFTKQALTHIVGKGRRTWAVAFDDALGVAFGNRFVQVDDSNRGPLEKSFDFSTRTLNPQLTAPAPFERTLTEHRGQTLERGGDELLHLGTEGAIENDGTFDGTLRTYTFTPDGQIVVGSSFSLKLYRGDGTFVHEFSGHTGEIWAVSVSRNGRLLASTSDDQTVKLWNIASGELLASLFVTADNEWICWTPQGHYAASVGGERYIGWHLNRGLDKAADYYPAYAFRKRFHNPQLVSRTIELGSFALALQETDSLPHKAAKPLSVAQTLPPKITWLEPGDFRSETDQPNFTARVRINSDTELQAVRWLVNGRALASERGLKAKTSNALNLEQTIPLDHGPNQLAVFAENAHASITSDNRLITYQTQDWDKPNLYVAAIGISTYDETGFNLEFADDDARAVADLFQQQQGRLYNRVQVRRLIDAEATRDNILDVLEWLEQNATQKDVVVLFAASHGLKDNRGNYYLLPSDGDPNKLRRTAVNWADFADILGNLPSKVLLFLDTCHSGQLGSNMVTTRDPGSLADNTEAIRELSSDENGVIVVAASTGREVSQESPQWKHGAFTKALLDGLADGQADYTGDRIVYLRELDNFIAERVKQLTGGQQHPTTQKPSTISRFPILQLP